MRAGHVAAPDIDSYIAQFPPEVRKLLVQMRRTIQKAAPKATEAIKYGMPTFVLQGNLVHFAGYKGHIGFYPTPSGITAFTSPLARYECSKGAIRFPLDQPLPLALVEQEVRGKRYEVRGRG